jgi:undecaprenyl-diphosphatase
VLLAVLAFAFGPAWLGALLACWAVCVAASRVTLGVHYLSDVVGGGALGLVCGMVTALLFPFGP